jgi:CDGSH-type Zn-finger protein
MPNGTNEQKISVLNGGPYRVEGGVPVLDHEGGGIRDAPYAVRGGRWRGIGARERQTLCRCGGSRNKPFCGGSHWYMGFKHEMGG